MKKYLKNKQGFTLVELIVVIGILVVVLNVLWSFAGFGTRTFSQGTTNADLQFNARMAADYLSGDLRFIDKTSFEGINWAGYNIKSEYPTLNQDYNYTLNVSSLPSDTDDNVFAFDINVSNNSGSSFAVESSVVLLNLYSATYAGGGGESDTDADSDSDSDTDTDTDTDPNFTEIMNNISSITVSDPSSNSPTASVPSSVEGVSFRFTSVSPNNGNPNISIGSNGTTITINRHNQQSDSNAYVILTPYYNGEPQTPTKTIYFNLKKRGDGSISIP